MAVMVVVVVVMVMVMVMRRTAGFPHPVTW